jgi:RNA polymerase sigma-70 factor (ECF subfamily)
MDDQMDDLAAIKKCRAHDWEAFRYLVEKYQARTIGHALAIVGNREDALDAVQEAFIDAFQALDKFDPGRQFYPWFYTILRNRCFKLLANRRRLEVSGLDQLEILAPTGERSSEELLGLEQALLKLTPEERELITLKHLEGLSYQDLAERLGIAPGTVMSRLYYARQRLKEYLSGI